MTGLLDVARQAEQAQLARDVSMSRHGLLNDDTPLQRAQYGGMYGSLMQDPADKARMDRQMLESTLAMMPMGGMTQFGRWFHATPFRGKIDNLKAGNLPGSTADMMLGPHVAKDTNISNKFGMGLYKGETAGQSIPVSIKGKGYEVPQRLGQDDYDAISLDMAEKIFSNPLNKDLFFNHLVMSGENISKSQANKIWTTLKDGGDVYKRGRYGMTKASMPSKNFGDYIDSVGNNPIQQSMAKSYYADMYNQILKDKGYTHIKYRNTAQREIGKTNLYNRDIGETVTIPKAEDRTSAIIINPDAATPSFGRGLLGK